MLRRDGYHVCEARDADHALNLLAEGDISLLLLDLGLPIGTGLALLDSIMDPRPSS